MTHSDSAEPSMDEILASIRRIISQDEAQVARVPDEADDDVLVLTEKAPAEPFAFGPPPAEAPRPAPRPVARPLFDDGLEDVTVARAATAFADLARVAEGNRPAPAQPAHLSVSSSGPTLEDMTRDLMRPMIKAWLDDHLAAIVRARVDEEINRIVRDRVG